MLNRAILAVRGGRAADALPELGRLVQRGAVSPYVARARVTRGAALLVTGKPADAERDFQAALGLGETGVAYLGMGHRGLSPASSGTRRCATSCRRATRGPGRYRPPRATASPRCCSTSAGSTSFKQAATPIVAGAVDPIITPRLLHGLAAVAVEEKRWPEAKTLTLRLADQFPPLRGHPGRADDARHGRGPGRAVDALARHVREARRALPGQRHHRRHPARLRGGLAAHRRRRGGAPRAGARPGRRGGPRPGPTPRATMLMAEAQEATGDRAAALDTYARAAAAAGSPKEKAFGLLGQGRLLVADGKWDEGRGRLEQALDAGDGAVAAEAAYRLGEGFRATGKAQEAADMYMTAAYLTADSPWRAARWSAPARPSPRSSRTTRR